MIKIENVKKAVIYLRMSKAKYAEKEVSEKFANHLRDCQNYCRDKNYQIVHTVEAVASGTRYNSRRKIEELLNKLEPGYVVVTTELSRLGRTGKENALILHRIEEEKKCTVEFSRAKCAILNTDTKFSRLIREVFNLMTEMESDFISERIKSGVAFAKRKAVSEGRKESEYRSYPSSYKTRARTEFKARESEIVYWLRLGLPLSKISKQLGVKNSTFIKYYYEQEVKARLTKLVDDVKK